MWKPTLALALTLFSCRGGAPAAVPTVGVQAARLQADFANQLESWAPKGEGVELTFLRWSQLPKYQSGEKGVGPDGRLPLAPGEALTLVDRHFHMVFRLQSRTEGELVFDYQYRHDPPGGRAPEVDSGRIVLTRSLMESSIQPAWRSCSSTPQCTVIPTYCGGYAAVATAYRELAQGYFGKIGAIKQCSGKTMSPPVAACVDRQCQPDPRFP